MTPAAFIKFLVAWAIYWMGDAVSRAMAAGDWMRLNPVYNRLMLWSSDVQGNGPGPWGRPDASDEPV